MVGSPFEHRHYEIRKQVLKLFGGKFRVYDQTGTLVLFANMKAFKLKEDIRLYSDESMSQELVTIKARSIIDWSAAYDVVDSQTQQKLGALKRKGWSSMIRDSWVIMDPMDNEVGFIQEDSTLLALLRRFLTNLIPQKFHGFVGQRPVFTFHQHFNPFAMRYSLDFSEDSFGDLDRRLGIVAAVLLCAIEGRQE